MAYKITDIEGIGPSFAEKLALANIKSVEGLLDAGKSKTGRKDIAKASGLDEKKILVWVNMADLFRIKGVSSQNAELLKASGVDTIKELRTRKPENLHAKMIEVNTQKNLVRQVASLGQVEGFVAAAKELAPMVTH